MGENNILAVFVVGIIVILGSFTFGYYGNSDYREKLENGSDADSLKELAVEYNNSHKTKDLEEINELADEFYDTEEEVIGESHFKELLPVIEKRNELHLVSLKSFEEFYELYNSEIETLKQLEDAKETTNKYLEDNLAINNYFKEMGDMLLALAEEKKIYSGKTKEELDEFIVTYSPSKDLMERIGPDSLAFPQSYLEYLDYIEKNGTEGNLEGSLEDDEEFVNTVMPALQKGFERHQDAINEAIKFNNQYIEDNM